MNTKVCIKCGLQKDLTCFYVRRDRPSPCLRNECKSCMTIFKKIRDKNNPDYKSKRAEYCRTYRSKKPEAGRRAARKHYHSMPPEKKKEYLIKANERAKEYAKKYPEKRAILNRISVNKRRALLKNALPKWLSGSQLKEIKLIYKNTPSGFEVDHIVPLKSDLVCGLHVPWNLQYLSASENRSKHNKLLGD